MRILIADDEKEIVDSFNRYFTKKKYTVDIAYDGEAALKLLQGNEYDLAFLDENMPELTGLEIIEYCKENQLKVKVVLVTGYQLLTDDFVKTVGADEYLTKPCQFEDIEKVIRRYTVQ